MKEIAPGMPDVAQHPANASECRGFAHGVPDESVRGVAIARQQLLDSMVPGAQPMLPWARVLQLMSHGRIE